MEKTAVDDFIKYAREQFGYDVVLKPEEEPDSFASIFGASFLNQNISLEEINDFDAKLLYVNDSTNVRFEMGDTDLTTYAKNMELAA